MYGLFLSTQYFLGKLAEVRTQTVKIQPLRDCHARHSYRLSKVVGPLFFGAVGPIDLAARSVPDTVSRWIIDLSETPFIDATAIEALESAITGLKSRNIAVTLVAANTLVYRKLLAHGTLSLLGPKGYAASVQQATDAAK